MVYAYLQMANDATAEQVRAEAQAYGTMDNVSFGAVFGAARSGNAAGARQEIERLHALHNVLTERKLAYWAEQTEIQAKVASAWARRAEGKKAEALTAMRAAADHEDQTEKHAVTPGPIMPARELHDGGRV